MRHFGPFGGEGFIMERQGSHRIERKCKLVSPAELKTGLAKSIVPALSHYEIVFIMRTDASCKTNKLEFLRTLI